MSNKSRVQTPLDLQVFFAEVLHLSAKEVESKFDFYQDDNRDLVAQKLKNAWLQTPDFKTLCDKVKTIGGRYIEGKYQWRVPGPVAKSESASATDGTSPLPLPAGKADDLDGEIVEGLKKSRGVLGELYPIIKDESGVILSGKHRDAAGWTAVSLIDTKAIAKKLGLDAGDPADIAIAQALVVIHSNWQRKVSLEETKKNLVVLAQVLEAKGTPKERVCARVSELVPYSERWVRELLPDEFKMPTKSDQKAEVVPLPETPKLILCGRCGIATSEPVHIEGKFYCAACAEKEIAEKQPRAATAASKEEEQQASVPSPAEEQKPFAGEPTIVRRKFDVWNIAAVDVKKAFGDADYPGAIPGDIVGNVLLWFLPDGGSVVDPMAGGGVTEDVCRFLGSDKYQCFLLDSKRVPNYKYRETIRFNDVASGSIPLEDGSADLVFADPPYGPLKEYGMTTQHFEHVIAGLAQACYKALKSSGKAAVLMQNYYEGGECTGSFVPLVRRTAEIFEKHGFTQVFEGTVPLHGKVPRNEATMTHIDRRLMVFQK